VERKLAKRTKDNPSAFEHVEIIGVVLLGLSLFMFCALLGFNVGSVGTFAARVLRYALGRGAWLLPIYCCVIGLGYLLKARKDGSFQKVLFYPAHFGSSS
jgi:S-DNA-T family DNA segregation ATPase FtsK/SpoIIIE